MGIQEAFDVTVRVGTVGEDVPPIVFTAHNVTPGKHVFVEQKGADATPSLSVSGLQGVSSPGYAKVEEQGVRIPYVPLANIYSP
jgi:hypothetical protein